MSNSDPVHHSPIQIANPGGRAKWTLYASRTDTVRLVVFVHGFAGKTVKTWNEFALSGDGSDWWRESDMLFIGYESLKERPAETAAWIRYRLGDFYPMLPDEILQAGDVRVRAPSERPCQELFLVGHSLGGFVLRLVMLQQARASLQAGTAAGPGRAPLLDATVRLFSPASAGFQPAGMLAIMTCVLSFGMVALEGAPAFTALKRDSELLRRTRDETEALVRSHGAAFGSLRAHILWARPEKVVERDGYRTDFEADSLLPRRDHTEVCKPSAAYEHPRRFVETGRHQ
jgi:hypothetical protein